MFSMLANLLRQHEGKPMTASDRASLVDAMMADADAARVDNASLSAALKRQLAGNHKLTLSEQPDGLGCFYGSLQIASGTDFRVDVLPPKNKWRGDMNGEAADAVNWVVYLDGEEAARAETIEAFQPLSVG